jgi:hypothetical protein
VGAAVGYDQHWKKGASKDQATWLYWLRQSRPNRIAIRNERRVVNETMIKMYARCGNLRCKAPGIQCGRLQPSIPWPRSIEGGDVQRLLLSPCCSSSHVSSIPSLRYFIVRSCAHIPLEAPSSQPGCSPLYLNRFSARRLMQLPDR